jgi:hypothetical protein
LKTPYVTTKTNDWQIDAAGSVPSLFCLEMLNFVGENQEKGKKWGLLPKNCRESDVFVRSFLSLI